MAFYESLILSFVQYGYVTPLTVCFIQVFAILDFTVTVMLAAYLNLLPQNYCAFKFAHMLMSAL